MVTATPTSRKRLSVSKIGKSQEPATDTGISDRTQGLFQQDITLLGLTLLTTSIWVFTIFLGCRHNTGFKPAKADIPLIWFDHFIRVAGPLLPLPILIMHWYATLPADATSNAMTGAAGTRAQHSSMGGLGALYLGLTVSRVGIYVLHTLLAPLIVVLKDEQQHPHILSDHILLGASLVAMFGAQAHMLLIDVCFTRTVRLKLDRLLMTAALLLLATLFGLTCAEMYYTARYFHGAAESIAAVIVGLVMFQIPTAVYLYKTGLSGRSTSVV